MESFLIVKSLMDVKVVLFIVWIIMIFTSAEEERKYAKVRDRENFDTFNGTHTIILGHRREGDRCFFSHVTYCDRRWFRVTTTDFIFLGGPLRKLNATISCIRITDLGYPSKGGGFLIKSGGIGHTSVIIKFNSLWNRPMKYFVELFGIYPKFNYTTRTTLAWYFPTNNRKAVKIMRRYLIATSRMDGFPIFSPIKFEYLKSLVNRPVTLPDGRPFYGHKYGRNKWKLFVPTVVNYNTFYRTPWYRLYPTLFPRRYTTFNSVQSPCNKMKLWGHYAKPKTFVDIDRNLKNIIFQLPPTVKTTTDIMKVFDFKKH